MNSPEQSLVWPQDFPPTDFWKKFFWGIRKLRPDISFFKSLSEQQAARTEAVMSAWQDIKHRQIAQQFGESISSSLGWKQPYFIPADKAVVVAYGPKFLDFEEFLWEEAICKFEKNLGKRLRKGFWKSVVDWQDKNVIFGDLIKKLVEEIDSKTRRFHKPKTGLRNNLVKNMTTTSSQRPRTCRACGKKFDYPVKGSAATRHHCEDCVALPAETRKTLERLNSRVTQLENQLRRLQENPPR
jgi:hypothetical protein